MGISDRAAADLTLYAEPDGSVSVDTGARFVAVGGEDLERILDRLAADGSQVTVLDDNAVDGVAVAGLDRVITAGNERFAIAGNCSHYKSIDPPDFT